MPTNHERAFEERPEVYAAWVQLATAIKAGMDLRRCELATLAAARRLRSSYCCLAHGRVLLESFGEPVREIALDHRAAGLDELVLAAAVRCFFSKTLDALCVRADASYRELEPELREALVVGRPIADS
jgi:Carboxymuconolactone decarboxylase family